MVAYQLQSLGGMLPCCFAIIPDRSHQPVAMFADLQEAMDWALSRLGGDSFRIKYISVAQVEEDEAPAEASTAAPDEAFADDLRLGRRLMS